MSLDGVNGFLDVESAALRAPQVGIANTNPQHILSVGSNLYVSGDSSDVLTVDGNVVCEGVKVGLIEIIPSYDLEAVANVGNSTSNTIQFTNPDTGIVATGNVTVGKDLNVTGNLNVLGTTTTIDTENLRVKDPIIELGKDNPGTGDLDLGLVMTRPSGSSNVAVIFDESTDTLEIGYTNGDASQSTITMDSAPLSVKINGDLSVTSNVEVGQANLFVDTVNSRVGIGKTDPGAALDVVGDVEISSNLTAASSKFSLDTNGTLKQVGAGANNNYIKLMKYFASGSNWKIATGSYLGSSFQWLSIRAKMTRLNIDVKTIQFNYFGSAGTSRVRDSIVIGGGSTATQANEIKVYNKTSNSTYEIYLQIDSATSVEVEITHRGSTIDDDYSTVATANNGAIDETGLTKIYDSGTTTDLRLKLGNVGIGITNPTAPLSILAVGSTTLPGETPATNGIYLTNNTNSANEDATMTMRVAGSSAGDPKLSWDIAGSAGFTMGMDNSDSDKFKLCGNWYDLSQGQFMEIDRLGNTIFDVGFGGGTILSGLFNYTETQQAIDAGVGAGGTITASTDIVPPPGTAGDVIAKFVNQAGGEAYTNTWYPGVIPISVGTVIYFGVWIYATQTIDMEFFRFHDTGSQSRSFSYTTPNKWVWFERTIPSNRAYNFSSFRFDNNSSGRTVYLTGLTIRVGPSQNSGLPFTPRYSPASGKGAVFTTHNLVAKEAAIKTLTGPVDIGAGLTGYGGGGLLITKEGYVQPGDINFNISGVAGSLGGNYLFQGIYDAYRANGQTGGTMTSIFQRYIQVIRMGGLVLIRGYLPSRQSTSTDLNYRFAWAELGLDGQRTGIHVVMNDSTSSYGTWSSTIGSDATYLTLTSTGQTTNQAPVNYNHLKYLLDVSYIASN